jgi:asparagine synthase (glutamine-hydrolysing)
MCGIAGYFSQEPRSQVELQQPLQTMMHALRHRGPDGEGRYLSAKGHACLGHVRLAILDLLPTGAQPMQDLARRYALVFNGEIYNFRQLREDLLRQGHSFRSTGDTEVLLRLLMLEGPEALARLRGMFALAFWDEQERTLLLARDRFAIKPMVYVETPEGVAFASEIRALRAAGFSTGKPHPSGFQYYLQWGSIAPPLTWICDVQSLLPGHWRRYRVGLPVQEGVFADIRAAYRTGKEPVPEKASYFRTVRDAVEDSVRHHLESDVPVGVFLSGGIDSSSLVSAVRSVSPNRVQTYTVTFEEAEFSEEALARQVALHFDTEHHTLQVTAKHIRDDLPHILDHLDQPSNDGINSYYVAKAVAQVGLKVVLSGTGGDEFFGGYPAFRWLPQVHRCRSLLRWLGPLLGTLQKPHRREKWRHLTRYAGDWLESYRAVRGLFLPQEIPLLAGPRWQDQRQQITDEVMQVENNLLSPLFAERPPATVSRLEAKQYLGVQLLRDIDVMAMAHALEVRVPLVDQVLLPTLWPALGTHPQWMQNKRLLYESLRQPLPPAVFQRPKQGFTFPFAHWIKHELKDFVQEGHAWLARDGWIHPRLPERLRTGFDAGQVHWSRLWSLAIWGHMAARGSSAS